MERLVVCSHKLFFRTRAGLQTTGGFGAQMLALAPHWTRITLCVPVVWAPTFRGYPVRADNIRFHPLPAFDRPRGFFAALPTLWRSIGRALSRADLALVVLPGYLGLLASLACRRRGFPVVHWVVGDWGKTMVSRREWLATRWLAVRWGAPLLGWATRAATEQTLTFHNGRVPTELARELDRVRISTTVTEADLLEPFVARPLGAPLHLLFVGRLSGEKGVSVLLDGVARLTRGGLPVRLSIAGTGPLQSALHRQVRERGLSERIDFLGLVPPGPPLKQLYRSHDVLVVPSLEDQQPKVVLEAMAQGTPVVATRVGAMEQIVVDRQTGWLVSPGNGAAIARAVTELVADSALRDRVVAQAGAFVREHTLARETRKMMDTIRDHFGGAPGGSSALDR